ncbi:hypothetical protein KIN20_004090 [Parelaphostrongylus tenuis]|uniref:Uncharacterized protein n=1 Tax=Parelaphostrongylus tenuis TaxID=148309 RepID=A0AAD5MJE4_PARTN|nr:hypothetical protein KIN20_004090 [Parelaphostrongylus tenuis]
MAVCGDCNRKDDGCTSPTSPSSVGDELLRQSRLEAILSRRQLPVVGVISTISSEFDRRREGLLHAWLVSHVIRLVPDSQFYHNPEIFGTLGVLPLGFPIRNVNECDNGSYEQSETAVMDNDVNDDDDSNNDDSNDDSDSGSENDNDNDRTNNDMIMIVAK